MNPQGLAALVGLAAIADPGRPIGSKDRTKARRSKAETKRAHIAKRHRKAQAASRKKNRGSR